MHMIVALTSYVRSLAIPRSCKGTGVLEVGRTRVATRVMDTIGSAFAEPQHCKRGEHHSPCACSQAAGLRINAGLRHIGIDVRRPVLFLKPPSAAVFAAEQNAQVNWVARDTSSLCAQNHSALGSMVSSV